MSASESKFWFPAKRYGLGWGIANCWQGLVVQIGYVVLLIAGGRSLLPGQRRLFWILFLASTAVFIAIHWFKGEKPLAWRWGK
jgi:hypothetical protein